MKSISLIRFVAAVAFINVVQTASGGLYWGELTGTWTQGVPEVGIVSGDYFTWKYCFEAPEPDGSFDVDIIRGPLPGVPAMDLNPQVAFISIQGGAITSALIDYEFEDPRHPTGNGFASGLFVIEESHFRGFGEGTISFSSPMAIPEPNCLALAALATLSLMTRRFFRR